MVHVSNQDKYWAKFALGSCSLASISVARLPLLTASQATMTCHCQKVRHAGCCTAEYALLEVLQMLKLAATVQKIVSEILPASTGVGFAKEARDLLIECCVEFITLISSEANEISEKEAKKTIACDHITKALEQLGFSDYVPAVMEAAAEHKEVQKVCLFTLDSPVRDCMLTGWTGPREEAR